MLDSLFTNSVRSQPKTLFWELLFPGLWQKFDTGLDSTVNSPPKYTPSLFSESGYTHTTLNPKRTTIRSSINVQLASLLCLYVCVRELDRGNEKEKALTDRRRSFTRLWPKPFQSWSGGHVSDLRVVKMPIKAARICQSMSQNARPLQLKNTGCTGYKHNALFTSALSKPHLSVLAIFSAYSTALLLVAHIFLSVCVKPWLFLSPDSIYRHCCMKEPAMHHFHSFKRQGRKMKVAHPRGVLLTVISTAHALLLRARVHLFQADGPGSLRICIQWFTKASRRVSVGHRVLKRSHWVCQLKTFWFKFPQIQTWTKRNQPSLLFYFCQGSVSKLHKFSMLLVYYSIK